MVEPLACVLRGLHEAEHRNRRHRGGDRRRPDRADVLQVAKLNGCNVIAVVKRDSQVTAAQAAGRG